MFWVILLGTEASNWLKSFIFRLNFTSCIRLVEKIGEFRIFFIRLEKPGVHFKAAALYSKLFKLVYLGNGASYWPATFTNRLNSSSSTRKNKNWVLLEVFLKMWKIPRLYWTAQNTLLSSVSREVAVRNTFILYDSTHQLEFCETKSQDTSFLILWLV